MEGVGSRLGRASSRYGGPSSTAAAVFSGPVRKWKRRWVHVSSSPSVNSRNSSLSNTNAVSSSRLMLCRWTPLSASTSPVVDTVSDEEPPKRKFRYTPIVALEEERKKAEKEEADESKASVADEHSGWKAAKNSDLNVDVMKKEIQDSSGGRLDLEL